MVNPRKGLINQDEGILLGKGIETKILLEEINQMLNSEEREPGFGLQMFNYQNIDLSGKIMAEKKHRNLVDIDRISHVIMTKELPDPIVIKKPLPKKEETSSMTKSLMVHSAHRELRRNSSRMDIRTEEEIQKEIEEEMKRKDYLRRLAKHLIIKPEDKHKIRLFVDHMFNQMIYEDLVRPEPEVEKSVLSIKSIPPLFLTDYMSFLRSLELSRFNGAPYLQTLRSGREPAGRLHPGDSRDQGLPREDKGVQPHPVRAFQPRTEKIEEMIGSVDSESIRQTEESSKDLATIILQLIKGPSRVESSLSKTKSYVTYDYWDSFFHGTFIDNFEKIVMCYLIKMEFFMGPDYAHSSVAIFAEIINHLLEKS